METSQVLKGNHGVLAKRKTMSNRHVLLKAGLGCNKHGNCFECPFWDCTVSLSAITENHTVSTSIKVMYYDGDSYLEPEELLGH